MVTLSGSCADADFQGFFGGEVVVLAAEFAVVPFGDLGQVHAARCAGHGVSPSRTIMHGEGGFGNTMGCSGGLLRKIKGTTDERR